MIPRGRCCSFSGSLRRTTSFEKITTIPKKKSSEADIFFEKFKSEIDSRLDEIASTESTLDELAVIICEVMRVSGDELSLRLDTLINECKVILHETQGAEKKAAFDVISCLIELKQTQRMIDFSNNEIQLIARNRLQFATSQAVMPLSGVLKLQKREKELDLVYSLCRICECEVPVQQLEEHSQSCLNSHAAKHRLEGNTRKIEMIMQQFPNCAGDAQLYPFLVNSAPTSNRALGLISDALIALESSHDSSTAKMQLIGALYDRREIIVNARNDTIAAYSTQQTLAAPGDDEDVIPLLPEPSHDADGFVVLKPLARGAYGRVWLGQKKNTGDLFAIKSIPKSELYGKNGFQQILAEKEAMATAMSEHVVNLFFTFQAFDFLFLVMEFMPGGDMYSLLENIGAVNEETACFYGSEIVKALSLLHDRGIVHCDLKPDNLMLAENGHLKLTDFGLSRMGLVEQAIQGDSPFMTSGSRRCVDALPLADSSCPGTPNYLAPEVIINGEVSPAADWWSLGVILYEMVEGVPPFMGETEEDVFDAITSAQYEWTCDPSPELRDLVRGLLELDPTRRFGASEVKKHPFFQSVDWGNKAQFVPFAPERSSRTDTSYFSAAAARSPRSVSASRTKSLGTMIRLDRLTTEKFYDLWDGSNYFALHEQNLETVKTWQVQNVRKRKSVT